MFVKLDDNTILDMMTGICYRYREGGKYQTENGGEYLSELEISFNGTQGNKYCSDKVADGFWKWLNDAAMKFDGEPK